MSLNYADVACKDCSTHISTLCTTSTRTIPQQPILRCGGRIAMRDRAWDSARTEFLSAFKAFEVSV